MPNEREKGAIHREIERQCSIGAGTCSYDGTGIDASGLLTVNADLDIGTLERLTRPPAPEDAGTVERVARAVRAAINRQDGWSGSINDGEIARAALAALSSLDGERI